MQTLNEFLTNLNRIGGVYEEELEIEDEIDSHVEKIGFDEPVLN